MAESKCAGTAGDEQKGGAYETVKIEKTERVCPLCEDYCKRNASKPVAVVCCEGACLRGEIARRAANLICHKLAPDRTVRVCLGSAFTKDTGQRSLVRNAQKVIALEGCFIECASRMVKGVVADVEANVFHADKLCDFNKNLFGTDEMPEDEIRIHAREVAEKVIERL